MPQTTRTSSGTALAIGSAVRIQSDRGAMLIMVAVSLVVLVGFSAIVVDYGILWVSRNQAQAAADAGALAGATAIAGSATTAHTRESASAFAQQTPVWGELTAASDLKVSPVPLPCPASAGGGTEGCVRVDVIRGARDADNVLHTNTLPILFGSLLGITTQGVRATATAQVFAADSINCPKPWTVADKWLDSTANGWDQGDAFDPAVDVYYPPSSPNRTGFSLKFDKGRQIALKAGNIGEWSSAWTQEIDWPGHTGSDEYEENIRSCPSWVPELGLWAGQRCQTAADHDPIRGCIGVKTGMSQGPTRSGVEELIRMDPTAFWNGKEVESPKGVSPRIVPLPIFHTSDFVANNCGGTGCMAEVVNVMGFFVEGICADVVLDPGTVCGHPQKTIVGRMVSIIAQKRKGRPGPSPGTPIPGVTFMQAPRLVQ